MAGPPDDARILSQRGETGGLTGSLAAYCARTGGVTGPCGAVERTVWRSGGATDSNEVGRAPAREAWAGRAVLLLFTARFLVRL